MEDAVALGAVRHGEGRQGVADDVAAIVAAGYDEMADRFADWQRQVAGSTQHARVQALLELLPDRPAILELGCGAATVSTQVLASAGSLTGVDISAEMLRRARERVPTAMFIQADLTAVEFEPSGFDAVVSCYVLNHVPRERLGPLLTRAHRWLRPGGYLLASFGASDNPGWRGEWLGVDMFFSAYEPEVTRGLVFQAGLEILEDEIETLDEPEGEARFLWILARRPLAAEQRRPVSGGELTDGADDGEHH